MQQTQQNPSQEGRTTNPLGALADAEGVFAVRPTGEFEVVCLAGRSPVSLQQIWQIEYRGPVTEKHLTSLAAQGVMTDEEIRRYRPSRSAAGA
jgi:hypothetical protein